MATKITLNIFSGRPNPSWVLSGKEEKKLIERLASLQAVTDRRPIQPPAPASPKSSDAPCIQYKAE